MYYVEDIIKSHLVIKDGTICKLSLVKEETYTNIEQYGIEEPIINYWAAVYPREWSFPCWYVLKSRIIELNNKEDFNEDIMESQGWVSIDKIVEI